MRDGHPALPTPPATRPERAPGQASDLVNGGPGVAMPRQIEAERAAVPSSGGAGVNVCRMHGAGGGAPKGNRNALKHGEFAAETIALKREIQALARMARETMAAIE
jgi:hypothetical protein